MSFRDLADGARRWFRGDGEGTIYFLDASEEETPLAIGGEGLVLTVASGRPAWMAPAGVSGEALIDDASGEFLYDDASGDILYEDPTTPSGGGSGTSAGQDSADTTTYVATTGDDVTGDGSSGSPYATVTKALATLPRDLGFVQTITIADGTYAEGVRIDGFVCTGAGRIVLQGNTTTPANVSFTGTGSYSDGLLGSVSACVMVDGPVNVTLAGIQANATASLGIYARNKASVMFDRTRSVGATSRAVFITDHAGSQWTGNHTVSGFTNVGISLEYASNMMHAGAGTLTITGPSGGGSVVGMGVVRNSCYRTPVSGSGFNITITEVKIGFNVSLGSIFQSRSATGTLTVDNVTTPSNSSGVLTTDCASFSTDNPIVLDHLSIGFEANSMSYIESSSTRTLTNLGATQSAVSGATVSLF